MQPAPDLPFQTIAREYKGSKRQAEELAAIDADRLAERGWRVHSWELDNRTRHGCLVTILQLVTLHYTIPPQEKYVVRVTYALGQPSDDEPG